MQSNLLTEIEIIKTITNPLKRNQILATIRKTHDGWKIATTMKKGDSERQVMTIHEIVLTEKQERNEKKKHSYQSHSYCSTLVYLHCTINTKKPHKKYTHKLLEIEENPFLPIEQLNITIIPTLQKI